MECKRTIWYVALAFGLAWTFWFAVVYPLYREEGGLTTAAQLAVAAGMFAPALAVVLTRIITHEGLADAWVAPRGFRRLWRYYVLAWFGPLVLTVAGAVLYYLLFPQEFDTSMSYYVETMRQAAQAAGQEVQIDAETLRMTQLGGMAVMLVAPLLNAVTCFGEEWGWRGYLLPKLLKQFELVPTLLISGVIWGLWHAPITALGHNYGLDYPGYPFAGIAAMCLFCTVLGVFMSYVTLRTGSCLPAVFAHGMINGCGSVAILYSATGGNPFVGPLPTGIIGGAFFVLAALIMLCDLKQRGWELPKQEPKAAKHAA